MKRAAQVALTLRDSANGNHLRVPEFGVLSLTLTAGARASKSYLVPGAPAPAKAGKGTDDFHFAPEKEKISIAYEIDDPFAVLEKAELQLFTRFRAEPLWTLDLVKLGPDWCCHGKHLVEWDGRLPDLPAQPVPGQTSADGMKTSLVDLPPKPAPTVHPDGYVTLEHSPYKLRLTVSAEGLVSSSPVAWTYFHILVSKLVLEYGTEAMLPAPEAGKGDHRAVLRALKAQSAAPPAASAAKPVKVFLPSNLYKRSAGQMFDNTLYTRYEALWGDGPQIPVLAAVHIRDSKDQEVIAPKALGNARFLWDWESKCAATGENFVDRAQDYYRQTTKPKGLNCHKDRGGKRGLGARPVFPPTPGYAPADPLQDGKFPFTVTACTRNRPWAAYSTAWRDKSLAGKTGVIFQPSRMAGDAYTVSVYLAWDKDKDGNPRLEVDSDAPLPAAKAVTAATGQFEIWRKVELRKLVRKRAAGMPALNMAAIGTSFQVAFIDVVNLAGTPLDFTAAQWDAAITAGTAAWNKATKLFLEPGSQHGHGPAGVYFRTRGQFRTAWMATRISDRLIAHGISGADADAIAQAGAGAATTVAGQNDAETAAIARGYTSHEARQKVRDAVQKARDHVTTWMNNPANGCDTDANYAQTMEGKAIGILKGVFDGCFTHGDGVYVFQVERSHNLTHHQTSCTIGLAHDFTSATEQRCGFLLMCPAGAVAGGLEKTSAHEIGHHFFLPHTPDSAEMQDYKAHDHDYQATAGAKSTCLMSYNHASPRELCGFCRLRLRGWDKSRLDPRSANNRKP